jgi:hypothetical protein
MTYRIGHTLLKGEITLKKYTIIDIVTPNEEFVVVSEEGLDLEVSNLSLSSGNVYASLANGISQPETQDVSRPLITVETQDEFQRIKKISVGSKVKFTASENPLLEIEGFVVRNWWDQYYLISELGVSVCNRYWKVGHDFVEEFFN